MTEPVNVTIDVASYGMPVPKFLDWLRDGLGGEFTKVADDIEAQLKPADEEPKEFGSIVRAGVDGLVDRVLWQRGPRGGWTSETGAFTAAFSWLDHPEVLRVGVGHDIDALEAAYGKGAEDFATKLRREIHALNASVVTAPEKRTCRDLLTLVAALLGES